MQMPKTEKGKSHSIRPVGKRPPAWCKYTPEEVESTVVKLAKEGQTPSRIGVILRDQYGVPLTKPIVGKTVIEIMKASGLAPSMPEDLEVLLRRASGIVVHLEKNKKDAFNIRALQQVEAKIHKLAKYYKREGVLPPDWKYEAKTASLV
jgi:small subunit ribosomal protein S15